ncbi:MAG TPA: AAA family ATPase [Thermomicrobiales bacterium]|nr:AAA family ATPase [Thermomicrobiales bacterium]
MSGIARSAEPGAAPAPPAPRGTVTLLFTDIEGSTRLLRRLGTEYGAVLAEHQRLLRAAFRAHGGYEVDTQGDAFFVAFALAGDAVRAALAAQRALAAHPWPGGAAVRVRMGLHTGEPLVADGRYVGLAVHQAARIGAAGHGGQILLSRATHELVRDQLPAGVALRELGDYHLKDLPHPEGLFQLVAPDLPAEFPPLKAPGPPAGSPFSSLLPAASAPLVGRERELAALRERLRAALDGNGGLALVGGEAGIGKTALVEALAHEAAALGALVLVGRCYDLTQMPPYGLWTDIRERLPSPPDLRPAPAAARDGAGQAAFFARARAIFADAAARQPLVLLLDDLQWADPASLDFLRYLARSLAALPLLVLATYRLDDFARDHPLATLVPLLLREANALYLELGGLTAHDTGALIAQRHGLRGEDADRLTAYLHDRADGHPFFTLELLRALAEAGALERGPDGWRVGNLARLEVPLVLRQVIDSRLARLGAASRALLELAAVIGQDVPVALWQAVSGASDEALAATLARARAAHMLVETRGGADWRFSHALVREVLYAEAPPVRRRRWHRQVGEALAAAPSPDPDKVAYHFQRAGDGRAAEWLIRAGERAQRAYAWPAAAERFEAAAALWETQGAPAGGRAWLLNRAGVLYRYAQVPRAIPALEAATRLAAAAGDEALRAYAAYALGHARCIAGDFRQGLPELAAGVAALAALPPARRARLRALEDVEGDPSDPQYGRGRLALQLALAGRYDEAGALAAGVAACDVGTPTARGAAALMEGEASLALLLTAAALGQPEEARRAAARARALSGLPGHPFLALATDLELSAVALVYHADQPAERRRLAPEPERAHPSPAAAVAGAVPAAAARLLFLEGRWAEAGQVAATTRAAESGAVRRLHAIWVLGELARARGEVAAAWSLVGEGLPDGEATAPGATPYRATLGLLRLAALLALDAGDLAAARSWLAAHARWLDWSGAVLGRVEGALGWAAYHRAAGDPAAARTYAERARAYASEPRQPLALLAAHRLVGELATADDDRDGATEHLTTALALADACAAPYERALTLLALAELRAATGAPEAAGAALAEARAICTPLEAKPALARADALAARLAAPAAAATGYPAGLSAREVEVLRLVAQGLSNAQVAAHLYLSPRTVGQHLRSIYNKLGVDNRTAAAHFAVEHRLA